jgi:sugar phosphate isomerase/epimerase
MRLAVQLYTLRDALQRDLETTLAALAAAGATEVELAGLYDRTPAEMRAALDGSGLTAISGHVPLDGFESGAERVVAAARTLGTATVVVPSVPAPSTAAEADAAVERIRSAQRVATEAGLGFATTTTTSSSARSTTAATCGAASPPRASPTSRTSAG